MNDLDPLTIMLVCDNAHHLCVLKERAGSDGMCDDHDEIRRYWHARISFFKLGEHHKCSIAMHDECGDAQLPNFLECKGVDFNDAMGNIVDLIADQTEMYKGIIDGNIVEKDGKFFKLVEIGD